MYNNPNLQQVVDIVPANIRQQYPTAQAFMSSPYYQNPILLYSPAGYPHSAEQIRILQAAAVEAPKWNWLWNFVDTHPYQGRVHRYTIVFPQNAPVFSCDPNQITAGVLDKINKINILGCLNVDGYCILIERRLCTYVLARDIAIGAGLVINRNDRGTTSCAKDTEKYQTIRWNTFTDYFNMALEELRMVNPDIIRWIQPLDTNSYILLEMALGILNHCNSETAKAFKGQLMFNIVPKIQNDTISELLQQLEDMNNNLEDKDQQLGHLLKPTKSNQLFRMTEISKVFNISPTSAHLILNQYGYIYKCNHTWVMSQNYANLGYMMVGNNSTPYESWWTQLGREFVISTFQQLGLMAGLNNDKIVEQLLSCVDPQG